MNESSLSLEESVKEVVDLIHSSRYVAAREKWNSIKGVDTLIQTNLSLKENIQENPILISEQNRRLIQTMIQRSHEVSNALAIADVDSTWIHGITYFGITTHYKLAADGTIIFRLEGVLENLPIFEQCAVIHEIDLFKEWIPFCTDSIMIDKIGNAELIAYVFIRVFAISRDTLVRAYGADCLQEQGKIVVIGESISEWDGKSITDQERGHVDETIPKKVPFRTIGWTHERIDIHDMAAIIQVLSPNTAKTVISARINLHSSLPQTLINFIVKNIAGVGLYLFQQQSLKVSKHPKCSHNERIRKNTDFYLNWVYPKLRDYCLSKGWEAPKITALLITSPMAAIQPAVEKATRSDEQLLSAAEHT